MISYTRSKEKVLSTYCCILADLLRNNLKKKEEDKPE